MDYNNETALRIEANYEAAGGRDSRISFPQNRRLNHHWFGLWFDAIGQPLLEPLLTKSFHTTCHDFGPMSLLLTDHLSTHIPLLKDNKYVISD